MVVGNRRSRQSRTPQHLRKQDQEDSAKHWQLAKAYSLSSFQERGLEVSRRDWKVCRSTGAQRIQQQAD